VLAYIIRRTLYTVPLVLGVCVITFFLFDVAYTPQARASQALGRVATAKQVADYIHAHGWDKGLFWNSSAHGLKHLTDTRFADHMHGLVLMKFGRSEKTNERIWSMIARGAGPSLSLTVPIFLMGLVLGISLSLMVAYFRATYLDLYVVVVCVAFMSISILVYILAGQWLFAQHMRLFPVYGYSFHLDMVKFLLLPVGIAVVSGLGSDVRFYRMVLLEEVGRDYVRTARAKGLSERLILFKHVLKNAMIPILTNTVLAIPFLFMGALLLERFFGIPGLGNMTIDAINTGDTAVIAAMVYLGALLFAIGNLATDISYTVVDPRVRLE
jgi:peptide/nickel transport system permease protein